MKGKEKGKMKHMVKHEHHKEADVTHNHFEKGGKVGKRMKKEHKVEGKKAHARLDKYARGGKVMSAAKMTPESPLSPAGKVTERPGMNNSGVDKEDD